MSKRILVWLGLLILGTNVCNAASVNVTVGAQVSDWQSTGVTITPDAVVTIEATGEWCGAPWSCYGPEGTGGIAPSIFLAPGLSSGGLVGKVGNNSPFFVGSMCSFNGQDHGTGTLYLAFNDEITGYYNNSGTLDVNITTNDLITDLIASFSDVSPMIDGVISSAEWQDAQSYNLTFHSNVDQTTVTTTVYFLNDGTFLYCASTVPFSSSSTAYFGIYIDGDHSHSINGTMSEPHVDLGYNKAGTNSPLYPIYDSYWAEVPPCGVLWSDMVTPPAGAQHAYSGSSELSYEFKIPLSDMTASPGETIGIHLMFSPNSSIGYMYPSADYCDIASWPDLYIAPGGQQSGNILVYATSEITYGYTSIYFDDDLPLILTEAGFSATVTDRIATPVITSALLEAYDELWILSTDPYSGSGCFSSTEISTILDFRNAGKGILIMADDGLPGHDYTGDANQISSPLGVTFSGQYNYGPFAQPFEPNFSSHPLFTGVQTIVCTENASVMNVSSPSEAVATYTGNNIIAVLDDGKGRVVFDVSFVRLWDEDINSGYVPLITVGNTPQYVKNIADWLKYSGQQPPEESGYITVQVQGNADPCAPSQPPIQGAEVRISGEDNFFYETFYTDQDGFIEPVEVPFGSYTINVTATGYIMEIITGRTVNADNSMPSVGVVLYPEQASLVRIEPGDGETIDDTKAVISLAFDKPMDLESLNDPNLLTVKVDGVPLTPGQDYYVIPSQLCPGMYQLSAEPTDPDWAAEIEFGYGKYVFIEFNSDLLDEDGNHLQHSFYRIFYTTDYYLNFETFQGTPFNGGHYLRWNQNLNHPPEPEELVYETTDYTVGLKGDLDPMPGERTIFSVEVEATGSWTQSVPVCEYPGCQFSKYPLIKQGEPRYFTGMSGFVTIAVREDAAMFIGADAKMKLWFVDESEPTEIILPMEMDYSDYRLTSNPSYQTLFYTTVCGTLPFGGSLWLMASKANKELYECYQTDISKISMTNTDWIANPDLNTYDYYNIPIFFDRVFTEEPWYSSSVTKRIKRMSIEMPFDVLGGTPIKVAGVFKPFVLPLAAGVSIGPQYSRADNLYRPIRFGDQCDEEPSDGQFEFVFDEYIQGSDGGQLLPPSGLPHSENEILDSEVYDGLLNPPTGFRCPVNLIIEGQSNPSLNSVVHHRFIIRPEDKWTSMNKHAGYLFLSYDESAVSLGSSLSQTMYGNARDVSVQVFYKDEPPSPLLFGGRPAVDDDLGDKVLGSIIEEDIWLIFGQLNPFLGLLKLPLFLGEVEDMKTGVVYAAPILFPPPDRGFCEDLADMHEIPLFFDEDDKQISEIIVDIPLVFHEFPAKFTLKYYGRPWVRGGISTWDLTGEDEMYEGEYHAYIPMSVSIPHQPWLRVEGHSPVSLRITDPLGNTISRLQSSIVGATYQEFDHDLDGSMECEVLFTQPIDGVYLIETDPNPGADPEDTYSITATWAGRICILANDVPVQDIPPAPYVFAISLQPKVLGTISQIGGSYMQGVTIDVVDSTGVLVASAVSEIDGSYECTGLTAGLHTVSVVPSLGYEVGSNDFQTKLLVGSEKEFNFYLKMKELANEARGVGYWKHQVNVHLSGNGDAQESLEQMSDYMNLIATHFNGNLVNPVDIFEVPQPASQTDSLEALQDLLSVKGNAGMNEKAKKHLTALLLNVASLKLHQTTVISEDSATASQAITYCYQLIADGNPDNDEVAKDIAEMINEGQIVPAGMIDSATANITYKRSDTEQLPTEFSLSQNYPNPFNPATEINFSLPEASHVKLEIFNIMGQKVAVPVNKYLEAGHHSVAWDGSNLSSGVYFYRIQAGDVVDTKKMVLLK